MNNTKKYYAGCLLYDAECNDDNGAVVCGGTLEQHFINFEAENPNEAVRDAKIYFFGENASGIEVKYVGEQVAYAKNLHDVKCVK